jgi:serine/threonine protein kinase
MPVQPGQMLSHYRLIKKIGEGGMGKVYLSGWISSVGDGHAAGPVSGIDG